MATKLDQSIAEVAVALGVGRWTDMTPAAGKVAASLSVAEVGKLPGRWSPTVSARKANAPDLKDAWDRLWFEAVTEVLAQRGADGVPGLLELMDRNEATYHEYVVVRLLRLAADGCEPETILARVQGRLSTLRLPWARFVVQEIEAWAPTDPRPLELLRTMAGIEIPGSEGDTIGSHFQSMGPDRRAIP